MKTVWTWAGCCLLAGLWTGCAPQTQEAGPPPQRTAEEVQIQQDQGQTEAEQEDQAQAQEDVQDLRLVEKREAEEDESPRVQKLESLQQATPNARLTPAVP